jgi:hypothetical protein
MVEHAHATKAMQRAGLSFESNGWVWAEFVAMDQAAEVLA